MKIIGIAVRFNFNNKIVVSVDQQSGWGQLISDFISSIPLSKYVDIYKGEVAGDRFDYGYIDQNYNFIPIEEKDQ